MLGHYKLAISLGGIMKTIKKYNSVEEWLEYHINHTSYDKFYPTAVQKQVDFVTIDVLYGILTEYVCKGVLTEQYEILCPNCYESLGVYNYYGDIPEYSECESCGREEVERYPNVCVSYKINRK
jgi:hypothetical protein